MAELERQIIEISSYWVLAQREDDKLGETYDAEIVISSKGNLIYHCVCGATSFDQLRNITMRDPYIKCHNPICERQIGAGFLLEGKQGVPIIYRIKLKESEKN